MFTPHNRILLLIGGLALAASLTLLVVFVATDAERAAIEAEAESSSELQAVGDDLAAALRDEQETVSDYLIAGDALSLAGYRAAVETELAATDRLRAGVARDPALLESVDALGLASAAWRAQFGEPAITAVQTGTLQERTAAGQATVHAHDAVQAETSELIRDLDAVDERLNEQTAGLNTTRTVATAAGVGFEVVAALISLLFVRRYGRKLERDAAQAGVLNRFTEVTTFAANDEAVAESNLEALALLVRPDAAVTHVLNRSKDRAVPEASMGSAVAEVLPMHSLSMCPGVIRGSIFVTDDASAPLSVHCAIYPTDHGTVACVPLAHGENVGAVHLFWEAPRAFPLEMRATVARIAEHAALAIANRRLMSALQGQADTDARTGLANSRAFDRALEDRLGTRQDGETIGVLMLDLDHFKDVNDRHGHPAGDEALRAFSVILRSCMRDGDLAARYGGEEFAVMLAGVDQTAALAVAERIRSRTESTLISLAPGVTERLTVSIGLALAPDQTGERIALLRFADEALYDAKEAGRNRVVYQDPAEARPDVPARRSRRSVKVEAASA